MGMTWGQLGDNLIEQAKEKRIPLIGHFELTSRCNFQCKMCYVCQPANDKQAIAKERTAEEWIKIAEEARDAGMLYLLLTGGEVFLRKDFKQIYEALSMMGFNIEIYTNATMITPEIAKWLGRIPPSKIEITMYGGSPETYRDVCGDLEGFKKTTRGIDLLLAQGINLELRTTVIRRNVKDFNKIAEFTNKRGVNLGIVNYISPRREGNITLPEAERLSPCELLEYEDHIGEYFKVKKEESKGVAEIRDYPITDEFMGITSIEKDIKSSFGCSAWKNEFWISWEGKMSPCGLMDIPTTYPFVEGFSRSWTELQKKCSSVPACIECKQCGYKEYCLSCPARLKRETGYFDKPAKYLCDLAKLRVKKLEAISNLG